jgi:competence ComEA-like helix-hairpin-helix protein
MGFLFNKPASDGAKTSASKALKGTYVIRTAEAQPSTVPQKNTFTIPASDTVSLPPPRPKPKCEPELELDPEVEAEEEPVPDLTEEQKRSMGEASELVHQIREALVPQGDYLTIPAEAVLAHLPPLLRGPRWPGDTPTGINLMLDRETLLRKLRSGVISYQLGEFLPDLPEGWAQDEPSAEVKLDLPTVVKAIPPELFGTVMSSSAGSTSSPTGHDYFAPALWDEVAPEAPTEEVVPDAPAEEAVPEMPGIPPVVGELTPYQAPASTSRSHWFGTGTGPKRRLVPTRIPGAWNGVEAECSASVGAVDINTAGLDELQALPGVGPESARMILDDRTRNGLFDGIYDLLRIRGIGRKRFTRLTGLTLRRRDRCDRHETLNELVGLPKDSRPGLPELVRHISALFADADCALVAPDGVLLASSAPGESETEMKAAIIPMLFRRTGRYLHSIAPGASDCVVLPLSDPPLLLFAVDRYFFMLTGSDLTDLQQMMPKAIAVAHELTWLMGPRALVR